MAQQRRGLQGGPSAQSLASNAGLADNTPVPAGSRFSEGQTVITGGAAAAPAQQQPKTPFYKKRGFIISQLIIIPLGIALLFILLFPVVRAIAQDIVNKSTLDIQVANITAPANDSFLLEMQGNVAHTGSISASISFPNPVNISWVPTDGSPEVAIGYLALDSLHTSGHRATINQTATPFTITNQTAFGSFTTHMITDTNFTWRLQTSDLRVQALKFPVAKGLKFNKLITLNGFQSFSGGVSIQDFQLPSDNPAGGIDFVAVTQLNNPSAFSLSLGTVVFSLSFQNLDLGLGTSTDTVIAPGKNNITLRGALQSQSDPTDLATVSTLFTNYLNSEVSAVVIRIRSRRRPSATLPSTRST
ncbi:hypothetical protein K438DRAFT_213226 [Mycena galopus ATCC 62051]|nr:hypothetical protein K438DRAFT_213226 [Mycena galopus ATCC 62051]